MKKFLPEIVKYTSWKISDYAVGFSMSESEHQSKQNYDRVHASFGNKIVGTFQNF